MPFLGGKHKQNMSMELVVNTELIWRHTLMSVVLCVLTCFFRWNYWMGALAAYNRGLPSYRNLSMTFRRYCHFFHKCWEANWPDRRGCLFCIRKDRGSLCSEGWERGKVEGVQWLHEIAHIGVFLLSGCNAWDTSWPRKNRIYVPDFLLNCLTDGLKLLISGR